MSDTSTTIPRPPSSARSSMIPETAPPSLYAGSIVAPPHRKLRLRIVTRHPLPELHFLAPFDPSDATCFAKLQQFIWAHLKAKGGEGGVVERDERGAERLQLQMDDFEVTFDDPEILRDGDTVEVYVREEEGEGQEEEEQEVAAVVGRVESDDQEEYGEDAAEREAILEASRVAALLRAGLHNIVDDDDDDTFPARPSALDDLPRMPTLQPPPAPKHNKSASSKASTSLSLPAPPLPAMPTAFGQGPAAAMAAFEAKRKAMASQSNAQASMRVTASTGKRKRSASSSSSSSSSSDPPSSSSSSSSSSSGDSSDSGSDSSDVDSDSSSSACDASSSAPSEHPFATDRPDHQTKSPSPTPPGSGTNRTKRRNQMRRKKLNLLREAENLAAFQKAQVRAALGEAGVGPGEAVAGEGGGEGAESGEGLRIKGSAEAVSEESGSGSGGGASVPVTEVVERLAVDIECVVRQREGGKGKGDGEKQAEKEAEKEAEKAAEMEKAQPRLGDMQPGQAAHGGQVPEGMVVRHVDCQSYYDEVCAMFDAQAKESHKEGKAEKKHQQASGGPEAQRDVFYLDYGEPSASGGAGCERKKVKLDPASPHLSGSESDRPLPPPTTDPANPADTWARIRTTYSPDDLVVQCTAEPVNVADVNVGTGVMWEALALDPETRTPGMMRFVGVVVGKDEEGVSGVRLEVVGPLRKEAMFWDDYEMEKEVWSEQAGGRPQTVWLV